MNGKSVPIPAGHLVCRFRRGDKVRWNALALAGTDGADGWTVDALEKAEGLFPIYRVIKGHQVGSATQPELEPQPLLRNPYSATGAKLQPGPSVLASLREPPTKGNK